MDDSPPTDLASAHALIIAQRQALSAAQGEAQHRAVLIEKLKCTIRKATARAIRTIFGA